jgi:hypothetical protein
MSDEVVYCPKCGAASAATLRFCTKCGTNLEAVSRVLTGQLAPLIAEAPATDMEIAYAREFSRSMYRLIGSIATFLVMMIVFKGQWWVFFLLFWVANCVRDLVQASLLKQRMSNPAAFQAALEAFHEERNGRKRKRKRNRDREALPEPQTPVSMPPPPVAQGDYLPPARTTGELPKVEEFVFDPDNPPPSVTEGPTQLFDDAPDGVGAPPPAARERQ